MLPSLAAAWSILPPPRFTLVDMHVTRMLSWASKSIPPCKRRKPASFVFALHNEAINLKAVQNSTSSSRQSITKSRTASSSCRSTLLRELLRASATNATRALASRLVSAAELLFLPLRWGMFLSLLSRSSCNELNFGATDCSMNDGNCGVKWVNEGRGKDVRLLLKILGISTAEEAAGCPPSKYSHISERRAGERRVRFMQSMISSRICLATRNSRTDL
mmetsp:Transcript_72019/g.116776  ORF Transcript_72019/g.116776 Transcript_72019/m.116776 type:complete len:219 (-) Transcript_72019:6176-6832(-)